MEIVKIQCVVLDHLLILTIVKYNLWYAGPVTNELNEGKGPADVEILPNLSQAKSLHASGSLRCTSTYKGVMIWFWMVLTLLLGRPLSYKKQSMDLHCNFYMIGTSIIKELKQMGLLRL